MKYSHTYEKIYVWFHLTIINSSFFKGKKRIMLYIKKVNPLFLLINANRFIRFNSCQFVGTDGLVLRSSFVSARANSLVLND